MENPMLVKDTKGIWYEVDEEVLKEKHVVFKKEHEITIAEFTEKRKKVIELVNNLDGDEKDIMLEYFTSGLLRAVQPPFRWTGQMKSINSDKELWTNIKSEDLVIGKDPICCFDVCCFHLHPSCCYHISIT